MEQRAKTRLEQFADNAQAIRKEFIWQATLLKRLAALLYAAEDKAIDPGAIRESYDMIRGSTGLFSSFRGNSAITVATLLSLREDRAELLSNALQVYELMKEAQFRASDYLVVAAYQVAANAPKDRYAQTVARAKAFYDGMKKDHYFLTGRGDYIFSVMLGLSDLEVASGLSRLERLFQLLRPEFHSGAGVQALAQVLVLGGESPGMVERVLALRDAFRQQGLRLDREYTLSSLGILALLPKGTDSMVREVAETYGLLRMKKGFGYWSVTKQELLLLSAGLAAFACVDQAKRGIVDTALSTSITNIIIAQQAALAAAAGASAAAAASSSSS